MAFLKSHRIRNFIYFKQIGRSLNLLWTHPFFHLFLVVIVAWHCFPLHEYRLFNGLDGIRHLILGKHEYEWSPHRPYVSFNIFQGMANVFYGFNLSLMPVYWIQNVLRGHIGILTSYLLYSLQYFLTAYLWTRLFCFSKQLSIVASWLITICALPFLPKIFIPPQFQTVPQLIDLLFFSTLLLYCFRQIGRTNLFGNVLCLLLLIAIPYYMAVTSLYFIISVVPVIFLTCIYLFFITDSKNELRIKIFASFIIIISALLLEIPQFLYGLVGYSAYSFFTGEIFNPHVNLSDASMLFQKQQSIIYPLWIILSVIGAFFALKSKSKNFRKFARLHLILTATMIILGLLAVYAARQGWKSSEGFYYEILLWPSYVAYSLYAIYRILSTIYIILWPRIKKVIFNTVICPHCKTLLLPSINTKKLNPVHLNFNILLLMIPLLTILANHSETSGIPYLTGRPYPQSEIYPPVETPIVSILRHSIALQQNSKFKGYEASFVPHIKKGKGISWFDQTAFDNYIKAQWGNEHRLDGLWYYNIPTLNEYTHLITPSLYLIESRLLSRPIDKPVRTSVAYTLPNVNILRMLGVSFIITNSPKFFIHSNKKNTHTVFQKKLLIDKVHGYLYLYKLLDANLGNYSPIQYKIAKTVAKMLTLMKEPSFPFQKTVIVSHPLPKKLLPARNVQMRVSKQGIHLTANSKGISTLLLPIQYSHCLKPRFLHKRPLNFTMQRADLVETLITFSGKLDAYIIFSFGPMYHVGCRLKDIDDMRRLIQQKKKTLNA